MSIVDDKSLRHDPTLDVAAKRALGIGDPMLLERRAADLAEACSLPLEAASSTA